MSVPFNEISPSLLVPGFWTEFDNSAAGGETAMPWKVLIIGQQTNNAPSEVTQVYDDDAVDAKFGKGSQIALMIRAFRKNNAMMPLFALPVSDSSETSAKAATKTLTVTGTATAGGSIRLYVGGQYLEIGVTENDSATAIAKNIAEAVTAKTNLPMIASNNAGVVTFTAKNKGVSGNEIDVRVNYADGEVLPSGVSVAIAAGVTGVVNPSLETLNVKNLIKGYWFNVIVSGLNDETNVSYIKDELDNRWTATNQKTGVLFYGKTFTSADPVNEAVNYYNAKNSQLLMPISLIGCPTTAFELASAIASVCASKAEIDPAMPLSNWAVKGIVAPAEKDKLGLSEKNTLLQNGCADVDAAEDGTVYIRRMVTTYKTNAAGGADTSYQQLETVFNLSFIRWDWNNMMSTKYPHAKLGNDGDEYGAGQVVMTPTNGKAEALARFKYWMEKGLVQNYELFKANLIVERNSTNKNRLDFLLPVPLMNQLFTCASLLQFR